MVMVMHGGSLGGGGGGGEDSPLSYACVPFLYTLHLHSPKLIPIFLPILTCSLCSSCSYSHLLPVPFVFPVLPYVNPPVLPFFPCSCVLYTPVFSLFPGDRSARENMENMEDAGHGKNHGTGTCKENMENAGASTELGEQGCSSSCCGM